MTPEERREYNKKYREVNKEKLKNDSIEYREKNKEKIKKYYQNNALKLKEYRDSNKDKHKENNRLWYQKNKEQIKNKVKSYQKLRKKNDNLFKFKANIRTMVNNLLKNRGFTKKSNTFNIVGCSYGEFIKYIESKFDPWMDWDNYGLYDGTEKYGWDIDHIIPMKNAKTEYDVIRLNKFSNLQPLCSKINRDIKRDI